MIANPCKDCERQGCGVYHDKCPEYQEFRKKKFEEYEKRKVISHKKADFGHIYSTSVRRRRSSR